MREPSMAVREAASEHIEGRQSDWSSSKPVVYLDICNLAFVAAATGVFVSTRDERPKMPLRTWIYGYVIQCVMHVVCVCMEYSRRNLDSEERREGSRGSSGQNSPRDFVDEAGYYIEEGQEEEGSRHTEQNVEADPISANLQSLSWWPKIFDKKR